MLGPTGDDDILALVVEVIVAREFGDDGVRSSGEPLLGVYLV